MPNFSPGIGLGGDCAAAPEESASAKLLRNASSLIGDEDTATGRDKSTFAGTLGGGRACYPTARRERSMRRRDFLELPALAAAQPAPAQTRQPVRLKPGTQHGDSDDIL